MFGISAIVAKIIHNSDILPASTTIKNGLSAYELAIESGYKGTVQEWLDTLSAKSAFQIAAENGYDGSEAEWSKAIAAINNQNTSNIKKVVFNENNELLVTLADNTVINLGNAGKNGKDGKNGLDGTGGTNGTNGTNGINGKDGVGISGVDINDKGQLIINFTDGRNINLDKVVSVGELDIIGLVDSEINASGELLLVYSNGQTVNANHQ